MRRHAPRRIGHVMPNRVAMSGIARPGLKMAKVVKVVKVLNF